MPANSLEMKLVAFLDILGFKDIVDFNSFDELKKIYQIFESAYINGLTLNKFKISEKGVQPDTSDIHLEAIQISDSIIIWTKDDTYKSYFDLLIVVRELLGHGIFNGLPLRACIDYGEFGHSIKQHSIEFSTNTFYGKSITSSYRLAESQSWAGGFMTASAIKAYDSLFLSSKDDRLIYSTTTENLVRRKYACWYPTPFKDGVSNELAINWATWTQPKLSQKTVTEAFSKHNKKVNKERTKEIIRNTIEFWEKSSRP